MVYVLLTKVCVHNSVPQIQIANGTAALKIIANIVDLVLVETAIAHQ